MDKVPVKDFNITSLITAVVDLFAGSHVQCAVSREAIQVSNDIIRDGFVCCVLHRHFMVDWHKHNTAKPLFFCGLEHITE